MRKVNMFVILLFPLAVYAQDSSKIRLVEKWITNINVVVGALNLEAMPFAVEELKMHGSICFTAPNKKALLKVISLKDDSTIVSFYYRKGSLIKTEEEQGYTMSGHSTNHYFFKGKVMGLATVDAVELLNQSGRLLNDWNDSRKKLTNEQRTNGSPSEVSGAF